MLVRACARLLATGAVTITIRVGIMIYEAILFDIDGTLVDSTHSVEYVWRTWAAANNLDADHIMAISHGRRSRDTLAELITEEQIDTALADMRVLELETMHTVLELPKTVEILTSLPSHRWAAVTSGDRALMTARMQACGVPIPEVMVTSEDVSRGKPDPEGYLLAASRLGVDPRACLVIEDAPAGLQAARAAGCGVLAVATSHPAAMLEGYEVVPDLSHVTITTINEGLRVIF